MESGRPILAAVGLFFGGLVVGSSGGAHNGTAHAATLEPPRADASVVKGRADRGPIAPALRKILASGHRDPSDPNDPGGVEPPRWGRGSDVSPAASGARCAMKPKGRDGGVRGARVVDDPDDPLTGLKMPELPIPRNAHVLKYIRYFTESHEGRKNFAEALRRSGQFQEIIAKSFRELGVPQDLLAVAFVESGFSTEALSTAGAAGLWQFMPATGRAYGLSIESTVDERVSIWRSTAAAAHHLSDLYERFRSWELALAAYNLGYDGLDRRLDEYETEDFWSLAEAPGALPKETAHYVPKVLAAAVVFANLAEFGFNDVDRAPPIDASELEVPGGTKLTVVARAAGTSLRLLRELNPELLADIVPDRGAPAAIHIPRAGLSRARTMLSKLAAEPDETHVSEDFDWGKDDVRSGRSRLERASIRTPRTPFAVRRSRRHAATEQKAKLPPLQELEGTEKTEHTETSERTEKSEHTPKTDKSEKVETARILYRVVPGDSMQQIAITVGLTVDQILAQAHVTSADQIKVGTLLDLRAPSSGVKDTR